MCKRIIWLYDIYNFTTCLAAIIFVLCIRYVAMQLNNCTGNVVVSCKNGRSRSPMYLAAYLILCYDISVEEAIDNVGDLLLLQRGECLDRYCGYQTALSFVVL